MKRVHISLAVVGVGAAAALVAGANSSSAGTTAAKPVVYTESGAWASYKAAGGTVARLKLPAGNYLVNAQIVLNVPHTSYASMSCLINGLGNYRGLLHLPAGATTEMTTIPLEHTLSLKKTTTVRVTCSGNESFAAGATVTALQVGTIIQQHLG